MLHDTLCGPGGVPARLAACVRSAASRPHSAQSRTHERQRMTPLAHRPAARQAGGPAAPVKESGAGQGVGRSLRPEGRGAVRRRQRRRAVRLEGHGHRGGAGAQVRKHARRVPAPRRSRVSAALPVQRGVCVSESILHGEAVRPCAGPLAGRVATRLGARGAPQPGGRKHVQPNADAAVAAARHDGRLTAKASLCDLRARPR